MGYSGARSALYGHRLADVFILYHKRTFETTEKGLTKGFLRVFKGIREGSRDTPSPTSEQAAGELITPPYLQLKLSIAKRRGLWYNEGAV